MKKSEGKVTFPRLLPGRFSVWAVIDGKDLMSSRCIKGRKKEKRTVTGHVSSLLPKRLRALLIAFPYSFAGVNKWQLSTSLHFSRWMAAPQPK